MTCAAFRHALLDGQSLSPVRCNAVTGATLTISVANASPIEFAIPQLTPGATLDDVVQNFDTSLRPDTGKVTLTANVEVRDSRCEPRTPRSDLSNRFRSRWSRGRCRGGAGGDVGAAA